MIIFLETSLCPIQSYQCIRLLYIYMSKSRYFQLPFQFSNAVILRQQTIIFIQKNLWSSAVLVIYNITPFSAQQIFFIFSTCHYSIPGLQGPAGNSCDWFSISWMKLPTAPENKSQNSSNRHPLAWNDIKSHMHEMPQIYLRTYRTPRTGTIQNKIDSRP